MKTHKEKYEIEKQAKNRAYAFILVTNQLTKFQEFCALTHDIDAHELCKTILSQ